MPKKQSPGVRLPSQRPLPGALSPPHPSARYPLRTFDVKLNELVGWTQEKVLAQLGQPDSQQAGTTWFADEPGLPATYSAVDDRTVLRVMVFGLTPRRIPVLTPYQVWYYANVQGMTWVLFLSEYALDHKPRLLERQANRLENVGERPWRLGMLRVVEVGQYSTGAVF